jgi:hypothetical protein
MKSSSTLNLSFELSTAAELDALAKVVCTGPHHFDPPHTVKHTVALGLLNKALNTQQAIGLLVFNGCSDDALALLRTQVEATINAGYIFIEGDGAAQDFADFREFRKWIDICELKEVDKGLVVHYSKKELKEIEARYNVLKPRFKKKHDWTEVGLFKRATRLDQVVEDELRSRLTPKQFWKHIGRRNYVQFRVLARLPWQQGSAFVHGTAYAIARHISTDSSGDLSIGRTPSKDEHAWAMYLGNFCTFETIRIALLVLGNRHASEWEDLYKRYLNGHGAPPLK